MFTISIEKECGCFKKSGMENHQKFSDKDAALMEAMRLADEMNETCCQKHTFRIVEKGATFAITVNERRQNGGCYGGGHCG
jgi:hypothetical protein